MNALEYVVSLKDKVSSRLDAIARSFRTTNTAARGLTGSIDSLRAQADGLRLMRNASTDLSAIQSLNTQIRALESEALLLPELSALKQAASIIAAVGICKVGSTVEVHHNNTVSKVRTTKLVERTAGFERFQYSLI